MPKLLNVYGLPPTHWYAWEACPFELPLSDFKRIVWVVEARVHRLHSALFLDKAEVHIFSGGESQKNWRSVLRMSERWLNTRIAQDTLLVLVGGGAFLDTAAFAASVYKRAQVAFALVPTTWLAMVDASIGGKNGINLLHAKNALGATRQPWALWHHAPFLTTLKRSQCANAFAEIIKYACVLDTDLLPELEAHTLSDYRTNEALQKALIARCVAAKQGCVAKDVMDAKGIRIVLNFGHTLGHAYERTQHTSHGIAIAQGMRFACWLSERLLNLNPSARKRLDALLIRYGLPIQTPLPNEACLYEVLRADKKSTSTYLEWVLLADFGHPVRYKMPWTDVKGVLAEYRRAEARIKE